MTHTHKAIARKSQDRVWTHCITPRQCAADPLRQAAHGNIMVIDHCSCGAIRYSEHNGRVNYGPWITESED